MARRLINGRLHKVDPPGVVDVSRLLVVGYVVALALGVGLCLVWMAYRLGTSWF